MRQGDKELLIIGATVVGIILVRAFLEGRFSGLGLSLPSYSFGQPGMALVTNPVGGANPYQSTVPGFSDPGGNPQPPAANININVPPLVFGTIAPYFPLFGFIGVDSTMVFQ